jgi:CRP-like cAMP-binding protein
MIGEADVRPLIDYLEALRNKKVSKEMLQILCFVAYEKKIRAGTILVYPGEILDRNVIGFVKKGFCRCYFLDSNGNDITRSFVPEKDFVFTELRLIGEEAQFTIEASEDCEILMLDLGRVVDLAKDNLVLQNELERYYIAALEENIREKVLREASFLMKDAKTRYIEFCRDFPQIEERAKKYHLASYLGITSVSLSRIRRKIKNAQREHNFRR